MNNIVIMFPGQGSQYVGMGKKFYDNYESVQERFKQASEILGYDLAKLCFNGPSKELIKTEYAQPAILTVSYAMYEVLKQKYNIEVNYFTGHSLGEITALTAAEALDFVSAVGLVKVRGEAMAAAVGDLKTGMMAVIDQQAKELEEILVQFNNKNHNVQIANYNSPNQTILAGILDELKEIEPLIIERGARVIHMNVSSAFHSSYMEQAVESYVKAINELEFRLPSIPVISSITGKRYTSIEEIIEGLSKQLTNPVRWSDVVQELNHADIKLWLETGPKQVLKKLTNSMTRDSYILSYEEDEEELVKVLEKIQHLKEKEPSFIGLCMGAAAATRNRNWDDEEYHNGVIIPYKNLQELQAKYESNHNISKEDMKQALRLIRQIFQTKQVPIEEQEDRISNMIMQTNASEILS